ncbi:LOW QUALITY PROTEIN: hypothetical protein TorRG33x02_107260 [Trema orientale]|uniref:Uncharacterized protein n=1 Tax=Trema orientale TaxID=63057 RepID=A0A2P5F6L9_TREOI|nr:LOW QUALITY PROTEIN: hypothetical protein TorRG33x02_107260 [Trema orientale]
MDQRSILVMLGLAIQIELQNHNDPNQMEGQRGLPLQLCKLHIWGGWISIPRTSRRFRHNQLVQCLLVIRYQTYVIHHIPRQGVNCPTWNRHPRRLSEHGVLEFRQYPPRRLRQPRQYLRRLYPNRLGRFRFENDVNVRNQVHQSVVKVQNLEQLLRRSPTDTNRLGEVEELNRRAFDGLHEACIINGRANPFKDLLTELLLAREDDPDTDLGSPDPAPDLRLQLLPLQPLDVPNTELLDSEPPKARIHRRLPHAPVHLNTLAQVPGGDHAVGDAPEINHGIGRYQIDLADAASRPIADAVTRIPSAKQLIVVLIVIAVVLKIGAAAAAAGGGGGVSGGAGIGEGIGLDGGGVDQQDVAELVLEPGHGDLDGGVDLGLVVGDGDGGDGALDLIDGQEVAVDLEAIPLEDHLVPALLRRRRVPPQDYLLRLLQLYLRTLRRLHTHPIISLLSSSLLFSPSQKKKTI